MAKKNLLKSSQKSPLWVIKVGSQTLIEQGPLFIQSLVRDVFELKKQFGISCLIVTSGAIASARARMGRQWKSLPEKQALSALGQPMIMNLYNSALQFYGLHGAQVLLTAEDFKRPKNRKNLLNTLNQLLMWDVIPVLNENDAVATEEIQFGDNDQLSALVALEMKAQKLILMTNVEGLYDRAPSDTKAQLIPWVSPDIKPKRRVGDTFKMNTMFKIKAQEKSEYGRGGMESKLKSAFWAAKKGTPVHIVRATRLQVLIEIAQGQLPGTLIFKNKNV